MPFGFNPEIPDYYYPDYSPHNMQGQYRGVPYADTPYEGDPYMNDYYSKKHKKKHKKRRIRDDFDRDYYYGQRPPYQAGNRQGPAQPYPGGQYQNQGYVPPYGEGDYQGFPPQQGQGQFGGPTPQYPPPGQYGGGNNPAGNLFSNAGPLMDILKVLGPKLLGL